jgi:ubiquinone/menaquinone biosynthesis C-methylase UbiE/adenylate cyclase class IV
VSEAERRNIEVKARDRDPARTARLCGELAGATDEGAFRQRDTYFATDRGRLKLREEPGSGTAELVYYERPAAAEARTSRYWRVPVAAPAALAEALERALGVLGVVEKRRHLFLWRNVRIHLDDVRDLGTFVELEAVQESVDGSTDAEDRAAVDRLLAALSVAAADLEPRGYLELLPAAAPPAWSAGTENLTSPARLSAGLHGLAMLRHWLVDPARSARYEASLARAVGTLRAGGDTGLARTVEHDVSAGYRRWAPVYDGEANPLIAVEQPAVRAVLETLPPGRALDAACGTGRHARELVRLGHTVTGVDASPEMLGVARARVPEAEFVTGRLEALPFADGSFDAAVCALALSHAADLRAPVAELARVVAPGGEIVVSDFHPFMALLGGTALFTGDDGELPFVKTELHALSDYLAAFRAAGLELLGLVEPRVDPVLDIVAAAAPEAGADALGGMPFAFVARLVRPLS